MTSVNASVLLDPVGAVRLKKITETVEAHRIVGPSSSHEPRALP